MLKFLRSILFVALILVCMRMIAVQFYIPSSSMEPSLRVGDVLVAERVSELAGRKIQRGDVLVFYVPPSAVGKSGSQSLPQDMQSKLARLVGLFSYTPESVYIKRVVGLPGDRILVQANVGVFVNGVLQVSPFIAPLPNYDLRMLGDIGDVQHGVKVSPYANLANRSAPIIVPDGHLFMMGDNRSNSSDSHVWGFLSQERVIGRMIFSMRAY